MPGTLAPAPAPSPTAYAAPVRRPHWSWWLVVAGASIVFLYAVAYVVLGDRVYPPNLADSFRARPWGIYPHAFFGSLAVILGPFQFRRDWLVRRRPLHRAMGKVYVVAALLTGLAGLYMAAYSDAGWITHLGFGGLAVALLYTTTRAYLSVRARDFVAHREWMIRSYALIFGAVTLRLQLPWLPLVMGGWEPGYQMVAWSSWVPNLIWAEWWVRRSATRERPRVREIAPVAMVALLALGACSNGEDVVSDTPATATQPGVVSYSGETLVMESFPVQLRTIVTAHNGTSSDVVLHFPNPCVAALRAYADSTRTGEPVWDQQRFIGCIAMIFDDTIAAGDTAQYTAPHADARDILGDSLPDGRYWLSATLRPEGVAVEVDAGWADLGIPR